MTPTRRVVRSRMIELARLLPRFRRILDVGIAGNQPPDCMREMFQPADGGVFETADKDPALLPTHVVDLEQPDALDAALLAAFDLVLCSQVLEHVWDTDAAVNTLWRLTAWGGTLLMDVPFLYPSHGATGTDEPDYWRFTPQGLERLLHVAGFGKVETWVDPAWLVVSAQATKGLAE